MILQHLRDGDSVELGMSQLLEAMLKLTTHPSANVRKSLIFFMVDLSFLVNAEAFAKYLSRFGDNQQKLV